MDTFRWLLIALASFLCGYFYVKFLSAHPLRMSLHLFVASLGLFAWLALLVASFRGIQFLPAGLLSLLFAGAGYALSARQALAREDSRPVPELKRAKGDPGLGHTAVIYFTHGEPETYDPIGWLNQFKEFDEQHIAFVPFVARPFFLFQLRKKYLKVGKSDHRKMHHQMLAQLERAFRTQGDTSTRFYISFLDDNPRPDAAAIKALNDGASRLIVAEVFLSISNHTAEGKHLIDELHLEEYVPIHYTGPMYDSATLRSMFVDRANRHLDGTDKSKVGVLLVGHGQPDEWDVEWPTETQHETGFRHEVLDLLEADGFKRENLSLAWMEFKQPKPAPKVEEFVRNGVERVLYFAAAISADAIHSQFDIPELVHKAKVPEGFPLINLGAWNDDPIVIQAIKEKIQARM